MKNVEDSKFNHSLFWPTFLIATLLLIFGIFLLWSEIQYRKILAKQQSYLKTQGNLINIGVFYSNASKSPSYTIQAQYSYRVNEKDYLGSGIKGTYWAYSPKGVYDMVLPFVTTIKLEDIEQLGLAKSEVSWTPNQTNITIFYDPQNPHESIMEIGVLNSNNMVSEWYRYPMIIGIILAGLMFLFFSLPIAKNFKGSKPKIKGRKISTYKNYEIKNLLKLVKLFIVDIENAIKENKNDLVELKKILEEFQDMEKQIQEGEFVVESYANIGLGRRFDEKFNDFKLSSRASELQKYINELNGVAAN